MTSSVASHRNRLAAETSPYLLQHADNPVDWYPWSNEALERARRENKPILLSIGYSACHWCHVMAHESFEDAATAAVMNELFINIKVDREERPDLDKIYQLAHQMLIRHGGGWPLTMFLSPHDHRPFFGGTYFPKDARHGMPAFADLLKRVAEFYGTREQDIGEQSAALTEAFAQMLPAPATEVRMTLDPIDQARTTLANEFDTDFGGFGGAPKFPQPTMLTLLLRRWRSSASGNAPDLHSLYMATLTLTRMAEGGIYDQLGGGFARYSVDQYWMIPHFEKMLYDNAQLLNVYAQATSATGDPLFQRIASETADWIIRDLQSPTGGYWSAFDADSEGHEGKFYVWDVSEVRERLLPETFAVFALRFGLDRNPNFEGHWHLHAYRSMEDIAADLKITEEDVGKELARAREILLPIRSTRVWPGRDEKVLTSWNGLTIGAMAVAARALLRPDLADSATRALDFIREQLWKDGRLLAVSAAGRSRFPAYLDDHAFLLEAIVELLQSRWRSEDLKFAIDLAETLLDRFADHEQGGFFFTADDHEQLMHRSKTFGDEAIPAGNAVAARALIRLGLLLGESRYLNAAEDTLRSAWPLLERYPHAHSTLLLALEELLDLPTIVIVRGEQSEAAQWRDEMTKLFAPNRLVFAIPKDAADLPDAIAAKAAAADTVAYVCRGMTCSEPLRSLSAVVALTQT